MNLLNYQSETSLYWIPSYTQYKSLLGGMFGAPTAPRVPRPSTLSPRASRRLRFTDDEKVDVIEPEAGIPSLPLEIQEDSRKMLVSLKNEYESIATSNLNALDKGQELDKLEEETESFFNKNLMKEVKQGEIKFTQATFPLPKKLNAFTANKNKFIVKNLTAAFTGKLCVFLSPEIAFVVFFKR